MLILKFLIFDGTSHILGNPSILKGLTGVNESVQSSMKSEKRNKNVVKEVNSVITIIRRPSMMFSILVRLMSIMNIITAKSIPAMRLEFVSVMNIGQNLSLSNKKNNIISIERIISTIANIRIFDGLSVMNIKKKKNIAIIPMPANKERLLLSRSM